MQVKIKRLHPAARVPTYGTPGSGGFDFYACGDVNFTHTAAVPTGVTVEVPEGHVMLIVIRSSLGKRGVTLANSVAVIDSDYRGEVILNLAHLYGAKFRIKSGDRIAQGIIVPYPKIDFLETESLSETSRGTGGFGSTGA